MAEIVLAKQYLTQPTRDVIVGTVVSIKSGQGNFGEVITVAVQSADGEMIPLTFSASTSPSSKWGMFLGELVNLLRVPADSKEFAQLLDTTWFEFARRQVSFGRGDDKRTVDVWLPTRIVEDVQLQLRPEDEYILSNWPQGIPVTDSTALVLWAAANAASNPVFQEIMEYIAGIPDYIGYLAARGAIAQRDDGAWVPAR